MAPPTSIIISIIVFVTLVLLITITAIYHLLARQRNKKTCIQRNTEDTIRLTLGGLRPTEQVEYMKHVRERNLVIAWEEAMRFARRATKRGGRMVGYESSVSDAHLTCVDEEESDLGSVKSGAVVLSGPGEAQMRSHHLAPPTLPWMKHSPTFGSSIYSSDSTKSKTPTVVEEWESEHGGFSGYLGMKQPVTQEPWV